MRVHVHETDGTCSTGLACSSLAGIESVSQLLLHVKAAWFCTTNPATLALLNVLNMPVISADTASRDTSPPLLGAIWLSTAICVPSEPMLPKPHRLYVAMSFERGERSAYIGLFVKASYATNSFYGQSQHALPFMIKEILTVMIFMPIKRATFSRSGPRGTPSRKATM
jgi:hypothetical protein